MGSRKKTTRARVTADLPAKLLGPRALDAIPRPRLFKALDRLLENPIVWVHAPAGAGKSTLLATYLASKGARALWYNVDSGDADPSTAYHYLRVGTEALSGQPAGLPAPMPGSPAAQRAFADRYFDALAEHLPPGAPLVFDDYQHAATMPAWNELFARLCASAAGRIPILVASRVAPPASLARRCGTGELQILEWSSLRFDEREVRRLVKDAEVDSAELCALTDGWAVAVSLLSRSRAASAKALGKPVARGATARRVVEHNETVFRDLAAGVLGDLEPGTKRSLLELSLLPTFTPAMATALTGREAAVAHLAMLYEDHLLVERHGDAGFRIHDLLRTYLVAAARKELGAEWAGFAARAAMLLGEDGQFGAAIELLAENATWSVLGDLVERFGPMLVSQGRFATIGAALAPIPLPETERRPWLLFWRAVVALGQIGGEALVLAERAFHAFRAAGDPIGTRLAWALAIEGTLLEGNDFRRLGEWLATLASIEPCPVPPEVALRVAMSELLARGFHEQASAPAVAAADRALELVARTGTGEDRVRAGAGALLIYSMAGLRERANDVKNLARDEMERAGDNPLPKLAYLHSECIVRHHNGDWPQCVESAREGLALAHATGIDVWNGSLLTIMAMAALIHRDFETTERALAEMGATVAASTRFARAQYGFARGWLAFERGEYEAAERWLGACENDNAALGFAFGQCQLSLALLITAAMRRDRSQVETLSQRLDLLANEKVSPLLLPTAGVAKAYAMLELGDEGAALPLVRRSLADLRRRGASGAWYVTSSVIARVSAFALENDIEPELVARMMRIYDIKPGAHAAEIESWPWAIKVRLFGGLEVEVDGKPLSFGRKTPTVPLAVLKVLAVSTEPLTSARLTSLVWAAGGRASRGSLDTALYRLRKLLGIDTAVDSTNARVELASDVCWTDVRAFELVCERISKLHREKSASTAAIARCEERLFRLYRGPLGEEGDPPVVLRARERCARSYARAVEELRQLWAAANAPQRADALMSFHASRAEA